MKFLKNKKIIIIIGIIIVSVILLFPLKTWLNDGGSIEYDSLLYQYTKIHRISMDSSTGYEDGWELRIFGIRVAGKTDNHPFTEPQKLNLLNRNEIIKVSVKEKKKHEDEDVLFTTYNDAETIDSLYNIFKKLETTNAGIITYLAEYYEVTFYKNDNEEIKGEKSVIRVYEEDGKYYAREPVEYAIYELTENEYNTIKEYSN